MGISESPSVWLGEGGHWLVKCSLRVLWCNLLWIQLFLFYGICVAGWDMGLSPYLWRRRSQDGPLVCPDVALEKGQLTKLENMLRLFEVGVCFNNTKLLKVKSSGYMLYSTFNNHSLFIFIFYCKYNVLLCPYMSPSKHNTVYEVELNKSWKG